MGTQRGNPSPRAERGRDKGSRCAWCNEPLERRRTSQLFCSRRCRQSAWRLRQRETICARNAEPKHIAYADPPFPGHAWRYRDQPSYGGEVDQVVLIDELTRRYDGWALSTSERALRDLLPLCPPRAHVCPWVKPIGVSRMTMGLHATWEPLIVVPARSMAPGMRDWLRAMPARGEGNLIGRKPQAFAHWLFRALGAIPRIDTLHDLYPGTGMIERCWSLLSSEIATLEGSACDR